MSYSIEQLILQKKPIFTATYIHPKPSAQTNIPKLKVDITPKKNMVYIFWINKLQTMTPKQRPK